MGQGIERKKWQINEILDILDISAARIWRGLQGRKIKILDILDRQIFFPDFENKVA